MNKERRTLQEYKEDVFDLLSEQQKLEWLYEISGKCCDYEEKIDKYKSILESFKHWLQLELEIKCKNEYVVPFKIALDKLLELESSDK